MRRLSKLQFGGGAFVGALIIGALVAHATGCNILSRHDLYIPVFVVCFICFLVVFFVCFVSSPIAERHTYSQCCPEGPSEHLISDDVA